MSHEPPQPTPPDGDQEAWRELARSLPRFMVQRVACDECGVPAGQACRGRDRHGNEYTRLRNHRPRVLRANQERAA